MKEKMEAKIVIISSGNCIIVVDNNSNNDMNRKTELKVNNKLNMLFHVYWEVMVYRDWMASNKNSV